MPKAATTHLRKEHKKKAGISSNSRKTKSWPRPRPGEEGVFMRLCHARPPFRRKRRPAQRIDTVDGPQLDDGWSKYACPRFRKRKEKKKKSTPIMQTSIYIDIWRGATNNHFSVPWYSTWDFSGTRFWGLQRDKDVSKKPLCVSSCW